MRSLLAYMVALVVIAAAPNELRCAPRPNTRRPSSCKDGFLHDNARLGYSRTFMVEDGRIEVYYKNHSSFEFYVNCHGADALTADLPSFERLFRVNTVVLESCPPPTNNRSYKEVLKAFNVSLKKTSVSDDTHLKLVRLPSYPQLTPGHFLGLESITHFTIDNEVKKPRPGFYFLRLFENLRELELNTIEFPFPKYANNIALSRSGADSIKELYSEVYGPQRRRRSVAVQMSKEAKKQRRWRHPRLASAYSEPSALGKAFDGVIEKILHVNRTRS